MWKTQVQRPAPRVALLLAAALTLVGWQTVQAQAPDRAVSRVYFDNARRLYQEQNISGAKSLLDVALEFDGANSDALYLRGRLQLRAQEDTTEAIASLEAALEADRFRFYSADRARYELATVLLRIGATERAGEIIASRRAVSGPESVADWNYLEARLFLSRGEVGSGTERLLEMLRRYPSDARYLELFMASRDSVGLRETRLLRRYQSHAMRGDRIGHYLSAVLRFMRKSEDPSVVRAWGERYFSLGGDDPLASLLLVENGADPASELPRFTELGGDREQWLLRRLVRQADGSGSVEELRSRFSDFGGTLIDDKDRNGYYEARYSFENGRLTSIEVDSNENGSAEQSVVFGENGRVSRVTVASGQEVEFSDYPAVASVSFDGVVYRMIPGHLDMSLFVRPEAGRTAFAPLEQMPEISQRHILSEALLRGRAYVREQSTEQSGRVVERLDNGTVVEKAVDENEDDQIDYYVFYDGGEAQRAVRDIDFDGYFEASELYSAGELREIAVDSDDNGRVDFVRTVGSTERREWDFNEDGRIDARDIREGTASLRNRLAAAPDIDDIVRTWRLGQSQE